MITIAYDVTNQMNKDNILGRLLAIGLRAFRRKTNPLVSLLSMPP